MSFVRKMIVRFLVGSINFYQRTIAHLFVHSCSFSPTCSQYAKESFIRFGVVRGLWLSIQRIIRCHPWSKYRLDPVPDK